MTATEFTEIQQRFLGLTPAHNLGPQMSLCKSLAVIEH